MIYLKEQAAAAIWIRVGSNTEKPALTGMMSLAGSQSKGPTAEEFVTPEHWDRAPASGPAC
jgi:hypothetical protein